MPLHTIRAKIEYYFTEANTIYGKIGVKVWINNGEHIIDAPNKNKLDNAQGASQETNYVNA